MDTKSGGQGSNEEKKQKRKRLKKLLSDIQQQLEFYFSDSNLRKDRFIKQEMDKAEDGSIDISIIANFNRMQNLTKDPSLVIRAMENCELLEVSADKKRVKRKVPLKESKYDENDVTVYVENLPHNVDHAMLTKMFSPYGNIAYVSLPRYRYTYDPKGFAFIEFTTPDEATKACKLLDNPTIDKPVDGHFPLTKKGRWIFPEDSSKEKALKRKRKTSEIEEKPSMPTHKDDKEKKIQAGAKEEVSGDGKVTKASKRKRETSEHDRSNAKKDAETPKEQKSTKKRKHSGEDDHSGHRSSHTAEPASEARSHKGQRSDVDAKGESAQKDKSKKLKRPPSDVAESHKRKRDDSISSVDSTKEKSSSSRKDAGVVGRVTKRKRTDSEASGGEGGDGKKKKRSRNRKHKRDDLEAPLLQIRVIPKKKWLELKEEYLALQKASRQDMKKVLQEHSQNSHKQEMKAAESKEKSTEPEFVPGVVLKIGSDKPFASRKNVREQIQGISPVAYIDLKDGDTSGYVRLKSAEGAKAILGQASKLKNEDGQFEVALVSGEAEEAYWSKLKSDRTSKLNQTRRKKKRGVDRILDKTEKVLGLSKKGPKLFE